MLVLILYSNMILIISRDLLFYGSFFKDHSFGRLNTKIRNTIVNVNLIKMLFVWKVEDNEFLFLIQ